MSRTNLLGLVRGLKMLYPKSESNTLTQSNKLEALREQRGLSIEQLEKQAGVRHHVVKRIEQGNAENVYADDITRLLIFFDIKYSDIFS